MSRIEQVFHYSDSIAQPLWRVADMFSSRFRFLRTGLAALAMFSLEPLALSQENQAEVEPSVQREIMDLTRQGLEAAKRKDSTFKQRTLTDDALDVGEFGIWDKDRSAASIASLEKHPNVELKDFSLSDYRFRKACDDVVVVAYRADLTSVSVSNGQQTLVVQYISAVWVRRGNTWRRLLSQHTTAPPQS
jgi:hypothetical protein